MRICPNCRYENDDQAETCLRCDSWLVEPPTSIPLSAVPAQDTRRKKRQYLRGLGLGLIPLCIFLLATGFAFQAYWPSSRLGTAAFLLIISLLAYIAALISTVASLYSQQSRFVGYGLLTAVLTSPLIGGIACGVSLNMR